ncbi:hypothetical protein CVT24_007407 [Panaeolus cyanescens]|uniref:Uncharacterized protein n=1 Tax=Panaeolus cyanescens TaxID=181874 RepID=A0A409WLC7_9AGAR|nr:hypothetical protein CVT24_007407 [Panaeolus cyanescens]
MFLTHNLSPRTSSIRDHTPKIRKPTQAPGNKPVKRITSTTLLSHRERIPRLTTSIMRPLLFRETSPPRAHDSAGVYGQGPAGHHTSSLHGQLTAISNSAPQPNYSSNEQRGQPSPREPLPANAQRDSGSASAPISPQTASTMFKIEDNMDNLSSALQALGFTKTEATTPLSAAAASLVLCADIPDIIPNTSTGARFDPNDRDGHINEFAGSVPDAPSICGKSFYGGRFIYYVSFGRPIASPPLDANLSGLNPGDVYLHLNNEMTQISVWQFRKEHSLDGSISASWSNVTAHYIANTGAVRHPTLNNFVLHCKPGIKPMYLVASTQETYKRRDRGTRASIVATAESIGQGVNRMARDVQKIAAGASASTAGRGRYNLR